MRSIDLVGMEWNVTSLKYWWTETCISSLMKKTTGGFPFSMDKGVRGLPELDEKFVLELG